MTVPPTKLTVRELAASASSWEAAIKVCARLARLRAQRALTEPARTAAQDIERDILLLSCADVKKRRREP